MDPVWMTVIGFLLIFAATTLGASLVFFFRKEISEKVNTLFLGFAAGIMIAASIWSLLIPSIEGAADWGTWSFVPAVVGFLAGGLFLVLLDKVVPHFHSGTNEEEGPRTSLNKAAKMFLAVTIHNIPEGLAVGFAFGAAAVAGTDAAFLTAFGLALGIAIQNFPEGAAVALPLKQVTGSRGKAFLYGMGSGVVEPIAAALTLFTVGMVEPVLPYLLAFAAGAMIYVVVEELIPEAQGGEPHSNWGTIGVALGFVLMMVLDVVFG